MDISKLHDELEALSSDKPAAYIQTAAFGRFTLERLLDSIRLMTGKVLEAGNRQLSATLKTAIGSDALALSLAPPIAASGRNDELDVILTPGFEVVVDVAISKDPTKIISELRLSFSDIRIHLYARSNSLILEGVDFQLQRNIARTTDADKYLKDAGIDPLEAARVEGHLAYGVISQAATSAFAQRTEFSLAVLFPAVDFGTAINLKILAGGDAIGIIPTAEVTVREASRCICNDGPDLGHSQTSVTVVTTIPPDPKPSDELGKVKIGGPIPDGKDPLRDFGRRYVGGGNAGLYIPKSFASGLTIRAMPAVKVTASDDGWIGFRAEASIGFQNLTLSFDPIGGGVLIDIDLDISVSAYCDMQLFKGLRVPIGWAIIVPANGSQPASLRIGFYPSIDSSGVVRLKSTLKKADMGSYVAVVVGIGTALKILGVTAWIGFLVDVVLSAVLSNGLPVALKKAVADIMGNSEWKLLDGLPLFKPNARIVPAAPFHTKKDSLLVSVRLDG